jgi:hypothetical protein
MGKEEKAAARINQLPGKTVIAPTNTQTCGSAHAAIRHETASEIEEACNCCTTPHTHLPLQMRSSTIPGIARVSDFLNYDRYDCLKALFAQASAYSFSTLSTAC